MIGILTSLAIFSYFFTIGAATLILIRPPMALERLALLCPATGVSVTVLTLLPLNQLGLPILSFGAAYATITCIAAAALLLARLGTIKIGLRYCWTFAPPLVLSVLITGRPFFDYGFNWLSFSNDDMANYAMAADKLQHFGYYHIPSVENILYATDARQFFWFPLELRAERVGSELLLAFASAVCHISAFHIFMPLILALQLALLCSVASLALTPTTSKYAVFAAYSLAFSALVSLGSLSQLIAQVLGLLFLASCASVTAASAKGSSRDILRLAVVAGMLAAADAIAYPETLPFLVVATGASIVIQVVRKEWPIAKAASLAAIAIAVCLLTLNRNTVICFSVLLTRVRSTQVAIDPRHSTYPYYLLPSGFANFWGFIPYPVTIADPLESIAIGIGAVVLVVACCLAVRESYYGRVCGIISLMMLLLGAALYLGQKDFGLYKLAMYAAPFVLTTLVISLDTLKHRKVIAPMVALLAATAMVSQTYYVERSRDLPEANGYGFVEVRGASSSHILDELESIHARVLRGGLSVFSDAGLGTLGKYETASMVGTKFITLNHFMEDLLSPYAGLKNEGRLKDLAAPSPLQRELDLRYASQTLDDLKAAEPLRRFDLKTSGKTDQFTSDLRTPTSCPLEFSLACADSSKLLYLFQGPDHTVFNRSRTENTRLNFLVSPAAETANMLVPVSSQHASLLSVSNSQALDPLEKDYFFPRSTFSSINRYVMMEIIRPRDHPRLVLEVTDSLNNDGENQLPPFRVIGSRVVNLGVTGRGSARIVSPVLFPQVIDGASLIELDSNSKPFQFYPVRHGLMRLFGNDVVLDSRELVGFARNISLISNTDYSNRKRPSKIDQFPDDLRNRNLEYSGLYEDGWVSNESTLFLQCPRHYSTLRVTGTVPSIGGSVPRQSLTVFVDGKAVASWKGSDGPFSLSVAGIHAGDHHVSLVFSATQHLPGDDKRPVSAKILLVGFVPRGA